MQPYHHKKQQSKLHRLHLNKSLTPISKQEQSSNKTQIFSENIQQDLLNQQKQEIYRVIPPLRYVIPYPFTFTCHMKSRWFKKSLIQVLTKEFKMYNKQYYQEAIRSGDIRINGKIVESNYILQQKDYLQHKTIRQQRPILSLLPKIVFQSQELLVVDKPPSFTIHAGGGFHYNTLVGVLQNVYPHLKNTLHVMHRLDRLTSGLILFGKNKTMTTRFHADQNSRKRYYARVSGRFPYLKCHLNASIGCISMKEGIYAVSCQISRKIIINNQNEVQQSSKNNIQLNQTQKQDCNDQLNKKEVNNSQQSSLSDINQTNKLMFSNQNKLQKQIEIFNFEKQNFEKNKNIPKDLADKFEQTAKNAETIFTLISTNGQSSLLDCQLLTGRTHQIRVHLKHLGFPILNDTVYGGQFVGNKIIDSIINHSNKAPPQFVLNDGALVKKIKQEDFQWDLKNHPWEIYLHSYQYTFQGKVYHTDKPHWY